MEIIENERKENNMRVTCCGDVMKLLDYFKDGPHSRNYSLYKIAKKKIEGYGDFEYVMLVGGDYFPIILAKQLALDVLSDPDLGGKIAFNTYMERYR